MKAIYLIANPNAGGGNGSQALDKACKYLQERHIPFLLFKTEYPFHTIELTNQVIQRARLDEKPAILVIGGDGTLHEVLKTLVNHGSRIPVAYLATGTGNDFNRAWQKNADFESVLQSLLRQSQLTHVPIFKSFNPQTREQDIVINSLGYGLDGQVVTTYSQLSPGHPLKKVLRGKPAYWLSALQAGFKLPSFTIQIETNNKTKVLNDCQLVGFFNSPYFGGGIQIYPKIIPSQTEIAMVVFQKVNLVQFFKLFSKVIRKKADLDPKHFSFETFDQVTLTIEQAVPSQVDGEVRAKVPETLELSITSYPFILGT